MTINRESFKQKIAYSLILIMMMISCLNAITPTYAGTEKRKIARIERGDDKLYRAVDKDGQLVLPPEYAGISPYTINTGNRAYYRVLYIEGRPNYGNNRGYERKEGLVNAYGEFVIKPIPGKIYQVSFEDEIVTYNGGPLSKAYSFKGKDLTPRGYTNSRYIGNGFMLGIKYKEPIVIPPPDATGPGIVIDESTADVITPSGKVIPVDVKANIVTLNDEYGDGAYDDYIMVYSKGEDFLVHRDKGIVRKGWTGTIDKIRGTDTPFLKGIQVDHKGVNEPFALLDIDGKQLSPEGVWYYGYRRTPTGLACIVNVEEEHYYWNDGRPVKETELASFDTDKKEEKTSWIFSVVEDPNWTKPAYYPTIAKETIDFSKDYDVQSALFDIRIGGRTKALGNQIWLGDEKEANESDLVIAFEGNNTVRLTFRDYGIPENALMEVVLNETFDRRVIYPALETIKHDIRSVGLDPFSDDGYKEVKYYTNELDGLKKTAGHVDLAYKDYDGIFEVVLTYPDDLYAKGIAAYEESLSKERFTQVTIVKDSMTEYIDKLFGDMHFHARDYYPILEKYFAKKYKTGIHHSENYEVLIFNEIFQHYSHGLSDKGGINDVSFEFTSRGLKLEIDEYSEASRDFIRYTLDGIYTSAVAKYAYEQIFSDIEYVMDHEVATAETGRLIQTLSGKVVTAGPFVIKYGGEFIILNTAYPLFEYSQLETPRNYEPEIVNLGYQPERSPAYIYNYFRPFGIVSGDFTITDYGVQVWGDALSYYHGTDYGTKDPDVKINYSKYNNRLDVMVYKQNRPFRPADGGVTEFMDAYFKLALGEENAKLIMAQIQKDIEAGHVSFKNKKSKYKAGDFVLSYNTYGNSAMSIDIILPE